ncbi:MAG TPA: ABC transporter ATP-binding protein [Calditrichaeota bacterium]|nr:ABC transporter ATP-binding protein [Calditrichota bacterium]
MQLIAENIGKSFGNYLIFKQINMEVSSGQCIGIIGPNGSGKTTLIRVLSKLISPSTGRVSYKANGKELSREEGFRYIGLIGPYLELYQDLTALENLQFFAKIRGLKNYQKKLEDLFEQFGLQNRQDDLVKTYSSGMKQRLKYIFALMHDPYILFIDEPRSNLDEEGIDTVYHVIKERKKDGIIFLATNEADDLQFTDWTVNVNG